MKKAFAVVLFLVFASALLSQDLEIEKAPAPLYRDLVLDGAGDPTIIYNKEQKAWFIFYTQRRSNIAIQNLGDCYGTAIGLAVSETNGRTWGSRAWRCFLLYIQGNYCLRMGLAALFGKKDRYQRYRAVGGVYREVRQRKQPGIS